MPCTIQALQTDRRCRHTRKAKPYALLRLTRGINAMPCCCRFVISGCNRTSDNAVADKIDGKFVGFSVKPSDPQAITFT